MKKINYNWKKINIKLGEEKYNNTKLLLDCDLEDKSDENNDYLDSIGASVCDVTPVFEKECDEYDLYCDAVSGCYNYYLEYSLGKNKNIINDVYFISFGLDEQAQLYDPDNNMTFIINVEK